MSPVRLLQLTSTMMLLSSSAFALDYMAPSSGRRDPGFQVAEPDPTNYTDLRLNYIMLSNGTDAEGSELGSKSAHKWDSANRISIMNYGPVCSMIPINCFTPSRVTGDAKPPAVITWGEDRGWDMLGGLEFARTTMSVDASTTATVHPAVDYTNIGINWHILGIGTEFACKGGWRVHGEANPWIGIGYTTVDWANTTIPVTGGTLNETTSGVSFEFGLRAGLFLTTPIGLQVGGEFRYIANSSALGDEDDVTGITADIGSASFGLSAGYRF